MRFRSLVVALAALTWGASGAAALELKDITFTTPGAGKVVFSHQKHLTKKTEKTANKSCKSCHDTLSKKSRVHYTMADMEKGKSCGKCHDGKTAFTVSKCTGCHKVKDITFQVKQTGAVHFSHNQHLKTMQCDACHNKIFAAGPNRTFSMTDMERGKSCGACHNGTQAFAITQCDACHPAPKQVVFKVKETGPTFFSHTKHVELYSCSACHTKVFALGPNKHATMAAMEKGKSCGACHNGNEAFAVAQCAKCHPVKEIDFKLASIGNAKFSHTTHLAKYKCGSCHTATFPLKSGNRPVTMSEMRKAKSCGVCHDGSTAFSVQGNCDSCHIRESGQRLSQN